MVFACLLCYLLYKRLSYKYVQKKTTTYQGPGSSLVGSKVCFHSGFACEKADVRLRVVVGCFRLVLGGLFPLQLALPGAYRGVVVLNKPLKYIVAPVE